MTIQFPEHQNGKKQADPKVVKLDKLATMLGVTIQIDGVSYGGGKPILKNDATQSMTPTQKVEPVVEKVEVQSDAPAPKRKGRPPKS